MRRHDGSDDEAREFIEELVTRALFGSGERHMRNSFRPSHENKFHEERAMKENMFTSLETVTLFICITVC